MELIALIAIPLIFAGLAYALPPGVRSRRIRPLLLPIAGTIHLFISCDLLLQGGSALNGWLAIDAIGKVVLAVLSILFFLCYLYIPNYLRKRSENRNRVFCTCLLAMLSVVSLVTVSQHFGLMWVALEATTLCSAPLLFFNQSPRSLEAAWKYMLICSVGIALALLGTFFLAYSSLYAGAPGGELSATLFFSELHHAAPHLSRSWLHAAFITLMVGYGTKLGLAPMHTWKPDAYGEAPGVVGALLAGGVTSCAFLAIARSVAIMHASGEFAFASNVLIGIGLLSMVFAAIFMVGQRDFKRMLAYSSVEHMGILVIGLGIGGLGSFAAFFHLINNAFTKAILFLAAGNIHRAYKSKNLDQVSGALKIVPVSAALFLIGFIAASGSPPFALFMSEFTLLRAAFEGGFYWIAGAFLFLLLVIFIGMGEAVLAVVQGMPPAHMQEERTKEEFFGVFPMFLFLGIVILFGIYLPPSVRDLLTGAVAFMEKTP